MAASCGVEISTKGLTYDKDHKWLIAEASELPNPAPVYNGANGLGYKVRSHKTNRAIVFVRSETVRDRDGDIQVWIYRSLDPKVPVELHVLND